MGAQADEIIAMRKELGLPTTGPLGHLDEQLKKARRMPIGTVSRGRKKVAEGKWVPVSGGLAGMTPLPPKWKAAAQTYGVSEETLAAVKKKGYALGSVKEALRHMNEFRGVSIRNMKKVSAEQIGALARQVREGRAQSKFRAEYQARKSITRSEKMDKASLTLVIMPGELTKAAKLSGVGSGHPAGLSNVGGKTKSKIPYTSHIERMKLAKIAADRMLGASAPEDESKHTDTSIVDRKGRVSGEKPPYTGYGTGVSGMESRAHDNFGRATIIVKPSQIGASAPEGSTKHTPVKNVRKPKK